MAELKYFTPVLKWIAAVADEPTDADADPQIKGIYGGCTVTASIAGSDARAIRAETLSPASALIALSVIEARLDDGVLKLNADTRLRVVANCPVLDLPEDVTIWYSFRFHHVTYNGAPQDLPMITIAAPFIPEDHDDVADGEVTKDLSRSEWIDSTDAVGRAIRIRNVPDDVQLVGENRIQFYAQGEPLGPPLDIDPVSWDTITGKPAVVGAGATQAAARTAIDALAGVVVNLNGDVVTNRRTRFVLDEFGDIDDITTEGI